MRGGRARERAQGSPRSSTAYDHRPDREADGRINASDSCARAPQDFLAQARCRTGLHARVAIRPVKRTRDVLQNALSSQRNDWPPCRRARRRKTRATDGSSPYCPIEAEDSRSPRSSRWSFLLREAGSTRGDEACASGSRGNAKRQVASSRPYQMSRREITGKLRVKARRSALDRWIPPQRFESVSLAAEGKHYAELGCHQETGTSPADPDRLQQVVWNLLSKRSTSSTPQVGESTSAGTRRRQPPY